MYPTRRELSCWCLNLLRFFFHQLTITTTGKENERVCEWVGESEGHRSCSHVVLVGSVFIPRQTKMRWRITGAFGFCINLNNAKSEKECFSFCFYQPVRWRSCCQLSLSLCLLFSWFFFPFTLSTFSPPFVLYIAFYLAITYICMYTCVLFHRSNDRKGKHVGKLFSFFLPPSIFHSLLAVFLFFFSGSLDLLSHWLL